MYYVLIFQYDILIFLSLPDCHSEWLLLIFLLCDLQKVFTLQVLHLVSLWKRIEEKNWEVHFWFLPIKKFCLPESRSSIIITAPQVYMNRPEILTIKLTALFIDSTILSYLHIKFTASFSDSIISSYLHITEHSSVLPVSGCHTMLPRPFPL